MTKLGYRVSTYADTSKHDTSAVWSFVTRTINWSQSSGSISDVAIKIGKYNSGYIAPNSSVRIQFTQGLLPAHGLLELQFGIHRSDWSVVSQLQDPSYLKVSAYTPNQNIPVFSDYTEFVGNALASAAATLGLAPLQSNQQAPVTVDNFEEVGIQVYSRKYRMSTGASLQVVTVDSMGHRFKLDSIRQLDHSLYRSRYGSVSKAFHAQLDTLSATSLPVSLIVIPPNPPIGLSFSARKVWMDSAKGALAKALIAKYNLLGSALIGNTVNAQVSKATAVSISKDLSVAHMEPIKTLAIKNDLWADAFRMNVDFLQIQGAQGQGVIAGDWESDVPSYFDQMALSQIRQSSSQLGLCRFSEPIANCTLNGVPQTDQLNGRTWVSSTQTCYEDHLSTSADCASQLGTWVSASDVGYCSDDSNYYYGSVRSICTSPQVWVPYNINNQHEAYMCAAIKNARTNATDSAFPNNPLYGGRGFAPQSQLLLGNFLWPVAYEPLSLFKEEQNALAWLIQNSASVVNQSWHNVDTAHQNLGSTSVGSYDEGPDPTFMDVVTDQAIWESGIVLTQASGSLQSPAIVVHKGANSIVVGQDNRDGYQIGAGSAGLNGSPNRELPHVTAGVNMCGYDTSAWCSTDKTNFPSGTSIFESTATGGNSVVTLAGGTSLASALTAGFAASVISINPALLNHAPWLVRAIVMASADNIDGPWWSDDPTLDQKAGAGRINGINAYLMAASPYTGTGSVPTSGFFSATVPNGTTYSRSFQVVATQTTSLRVGLSWLAAVDQSYNENLADLDLTVTGPGPDGSPTTWTSSSLVNPVEMVHAEVTAGQIYNITVTMSSPTVYDVPFGLAWVNR